MAINIKYIHATVKHFFLILFFLVSINNQINSKAPNQNYLEKSVTLNWIDNKPPGRFAGNTLGVPWPKGLISKDEKFAIDDGFSEQFMTQTWPLAYWPDGSVKWTAVAVSPNKCIKGNLRLVVSKGTMPAEKIKSIETDDNIIINTGVINTVINKKGDVIIASITRGGSEIANNGKLVMTMQKCSEVSNSHFLVKEKFTGNINRISLEQPGPVRTVVKIEGTHISEPGNSLIPFIIRLYFYANGENIRVIHTIIYNGDENLDFISGLGFTFNVPMKGEFHNRHVRFVGENNGVFGESVRGLTGLRRNPGDDIISAQIEGRETPALDKFPEPILKGINYIPAFGDYKLTQIASNSFSISKRTTEGFSWLTSAVGHRASGVGYIGGPSGGMAFGIRNFWQSYPSQIDIRDAAGSSAVVTLWFWAPDAHPMDMRFYHDGMGQDTYEKQWEGLEITYEDYEQGYEKPYGVARTSEFDLWVVEATPTRNELIEYAGMVTQPPTLMADLNHIQNAKVFGNLWSVRNESSPIMIRINKKLDWLFDYYKLQQDQHNWYGFWNFGDFMHTYDTHRHVWRYDVGGYAWDNSELSTDLWLWYYFLHSGRSDVFRMAEAMTRHTGEVDVHHLGRFAPLGSRHNVLHWGCSAKQMRISTAINRRFYYYLTADERTGELLNEQLHAHRSLYNIRPLRKRGVTQSPNPDKAWLSFGTDWGSMLGAWLTHWERTGCDSMRVKIKQSMESIAAQPRGFFTGGGLMDLNTGVFYKSDNDNVTVSHLSAVFGLVEICAEIVDLIESPLFEKAWLQYCELYNASPKEQRAVLGTDLGKMGLRQGHSRLTAFVAKKKQSEKLAKRSWNEFVNNNAQNSLSIPSIQNVIPPNVLNPVGEAPEISTNYAAQWGLAAIQCMSLINEYIVKLKLDEKK